MLLIDVLRYLRSSESQMPSTSTPTARVLVAATALMGAIAAVALQSTATLLSYHAHAVWIAILSQQQNKKLPYDFTRSTEDHHADSNGFNQGPFKDIRDSLDGRFHVRYSKQRQEFQDKIILNALAEHPECLAQEHQWIVFTAGAMGAGKSHTVKYLHQQGLFPLNAFVTVDPDAVRQQLPEFPFILEQAPELAGELTRKESGMIAEILTKAALLANRNVLVDGSLRNAQWYRQHFAELRKQYPNLRIAILHITAPREAVFERALIRSQVTGRVVPRELLETTMAIVPESVAQLVPYVDFFVELHNNDHVELVSTMSWEEFQNHWGSNIECHLPPLALA